MTESEYWQRWLTRRTARRRVLQGGAVGAMGAATWALVGCGGDDDTSSTTPSADKSSQPAASPSATQQIKKGGSIVVRRPSSFTFGDPQRSSSGYDTTSNLLLAAPLLNMTKSGELKAYIAAAWEQPDATTINLKLRDGIVFTDGTPVDADAVKFSLMRYLTPALASPARGTMTAIESVNAPDKSTVVIKLGKPNATFAQALAGPAPGGGSALLSPTAVSKLGDDKFNEAPVTVGPYKIESYDRGAQMVLVKNPDWKITEEDGSVLPYLDKITFKVIPDAAVSMASLQAGEIDIDYVPSADNLAQVKSNSSLAFIEAQATGLTALSFVTNKPPVDKVAFRKAINYGVDRDEVVAVIAAGAGQPAKGPLSPATWAYDKSLPSYGYDPQKAKASLSEAGFPNGTDLTVLTYTSNPYPKYGELLQAQLAKIGIKVKVESVEVPVFTEQFRAKANYIAAVEGMPVASGDPWSFFQQRYGTQGQYNAGKVPNPEFDALIDKAATELDKQKRGDIYHQLVKLDYDNAMRAWLLWSNSLTFYNKNVQGLDTLPIYNGQVDLRRAWRKA